MQLTIDTKALTDALKHLAPIAPSRTPRPILTCAHIGVTGEGAVQLTATDMDQSLRMFVPQAEVQRDGEACVPLETLSRIAASCEDPTLTLSVAGDELTITTASSRFTLHTMPADLFPDWNSPSAATAAFSLPAPTLARVIDSGLFAVARETSRYAINGILFEFAGGNVTAATTDGRRLVTQHVCKAEGDAQPIIQADALRAASKLIAKADDDVRVNIGDGGVTFAMDGFALHSKLIEGNFPPYRDVLPKEHDRTARVQTDVLLSAMTRAALMTNEESKGVRMSFSSDGLQLSSRAPELGEADVQVPLDGYEGEPIEIGANPYFIRDAIKACPDDEVRIEMKRPNTPIDMHAVAHDWRCVVMPISLG